MAISSGFVIQTGPDSWRTGSEYKQENIDIYLRQFWDVNNFLLENPNLNSTHLFRADIIYDSAHKLKTIFEKESACDVSGILQRSSTENGTGTANPASDQSTAYPGVSTDGLTVMRTVVRRLIPRKPQLDNPLDQTCYFCQVDPSTHTVIYVPHIKSPDESPWYHPPVRALAYVFEATASSTTTQTPQTSISVQFLPFSGADPLPERVHRTFISLIKTFIRLAKSPGHPACSKLESQNGEFCHLNQSIAPSAIKDTIIPQHIVQDTYTRLKEQYASNLINRWVEKTEPAKHVFEDLSIAAFLIELWRQMYPPPTDFPGFVDIACGNGVLVYILLQEGFHGTGFDARRRKTWDILDLDDALEERICIPQPFVDAIDDHSAQHNRDPAATIDMLLGATILNGEFSPGTFIISNHADELTPWTPILAALSSPTNPLPFLAIPCCSHALSGAKHRYQPKDSYIPSTTTKEEASKTGDLRALHKAKQAAANHSDDKSMYACLTRKVVSLAEELGFEVELTLMRIPSTRNIGIVGNRKKVALQSKVHHVVETKSENSVVGAEVNKKISELLERECKMSGGIEAAARTWIERAQSLQKPKGRGKLNLGHKPEADAEHDIVQQ